MRATAIEPEAYDNFAALLESMHRLRARVFQDRLDWGVAVADGREADAFDSSNPSYVLALSEQTRVLGCARFNGRPKLREVDPSKHLEHRRRPACK